MRLKKKDPQPVHIYRVTISPDYGMGLNDVLVVRALVEEAIRDSGMDNGASVKVEIVTEVKP